MALIALPFFLPAVLQSRFKESPEPHFATCILALRSFLKRRRHKELNTFVPPEERYVRLCIPRAYEVHVPDFSSSVLCMYAVGTLCFSAAFSIQPELCT